VVGLKMIHFQPALWEQRHSSSLIKNQSALFRAISW